MLHNMYNLALCTVHTTHTHSRANTTDQPLLLCYLLCVWWTQRLNQSASDLLRPYIIHGTRKLLYTDENVGSVLETVLAFTSLKTKSNLIEDFMLKAEIVPVIKEEKQRHALAFWSDEMYVVCSTRSPVFCRLRLFADGIPATGYLSLCKTFSVCWTLPGAANEKLKSPTRWEWWATLLSLMPSYRNNFVLCHVEAATAKNKQQIYVNILRLS